MSSAVLVVDGVSFPFSDATERSACFGTYEWENVSLSWTAGEQVEIMIVSRDTQELTYPALFVRDETVTEVDGTTAKMMFTVNVLPAPAFPISVHYKTEVIAGGATAGAEGAELSLL